MSGWAGETTAISRSLDSSRARTPRGRAVTGTPRNATSVSPLLTCSTSSSLAPTPRLTRAPGWRRWKSWRTEGRSTAATVGIRPTVRRPRTSPTVAATSAAARSAASRHCRAAGRNAAPAGVNRTRRLVRSNSLAPNSFSRRAIWWLSADWTTRQRWAALVKLFVSATAITYRICWSSMHPS